MRVELQNRLGDIRQQLFEVVEQQQHLSPLKERPEILRRTYGLGDGRLDKSHIGEGGQ